MIKSDMFTGTVLSLWASPGDHLVQEEPEGVPWETWEFNISDHAQTTEETGAVRAYRANNFNMACINQAGFLITKGYFIYLKKQNSTNGAATPFPSTWGNCKRPLKWKAFSHCRSYKSFQMDQPQMSSVLLSLFGVETNFLKYPHCFSESLFPLFGCLQIGLCPGECERSCPL